MTTAPATPAHLVEQLADEFSFAALGYRVILDAFAYASAKQWRRRAVQLEDARPRPGDYHGTATHADLSAQWRRLTTAAAACRQRADWLDGVRHELDGTITDAAASAQHHPGAAA